MCVFYKLINVFALRLNRPRPDPVCGKILVLVIPGLVSGPGSCIWYLERVRAWHYSRCFVPCFCLITSIWFLHNFLISMRAIRVLPGMAVRPGKDYAPSGTCPVPLHIGHFLSCQENPWPSLLGRNLGTKPLLQSHTGHFFIFGFLSVAGVDTPTPPDRTGVMQTPSITLQNPRILFSRGHTEMR